MAADLCTAANTSSLQERMKSERFSFAHPREQNSKNNLRGINLTEDLSSLVLV